MKQTLLIMMAFGAILPLMAQQNEVKALLKSGEVSMPARILLTTLKRK